MVVNNTVGHFVGLTWGSDIFEKMGISERGALKQRTETPLYILYWGFKKIPRKVCLLFCNKKNCFFASLSLHFSMFPFAYFLHFFNVFCTPLCNPENYHHLDGLVLAQLYTYVLNKILQNGAKTMQQLTPGFKNHMRNLENLRQAKESPKS